MKTRRQFTGSFEDTADWSLLSLSQVLVDQPVEVRGSTAVSASENQQVPASSASAIVSQLRFVVFTSASFRFASLYVDTLEVCIVWRLSWTV